MKTKGVTTTILLLFVGISLVTLLIKENNAEKTKENATLKVASNNVQNPGQTTPTTRTIVYYFHNTTRCRTCRRIEALTRKAIETGLSEDLQKGMIKLQVLNMEKPNNEHFVQDYQLTTSAVVVSLLRNGSQVNWKRLDRVWELVRNETAFISYIQDETRPLLTEEN
ncbi:hypothetical protein J7M07_05585 [bacterium]|nr:hypothetical protein [bacterium]